MYKRQDLENAIAQYANQEQQLREKLKDAETGNEALLLQNYEKDTKIFNQTNRINELESWEVIWRQRSNTLDQVYASRTWRYTHKIVTILRKLFPAGSWQSKLVGSILRVPLRFEHWIRDNIHQKKLEKQRRQDVYKRQAPGRPARAAPCTTASRRTGFRRPAAIQNGACPLLRL